MKTQIEKLIDLAKDYVVFGIEVGLPDTHNHLRGGHQDKPLFHQEGDLVSLYFSNKGETWQVQFKSVKIIGYTSNIEIPFDSTEDSLEAIYNSAKEYLDNHLLPNVAKCKISTMKERHFKIKEMERELRKLKGLV